MIRNYMVTARRNFVRQKWYTIINITGLACGLACCLFIFLWIIDEVSYDQFHREKEKIFQVIDNQTYNGEVSTTQVTPGPLAEALKTDVPEIDLATRVSFKSTCLLTYKEKVFYEEGVYADPDFFKIFTFQVIVGDKNNPLPDQSSIAISSTIARKYFGSENPLGKVYKIDGATDLKVTAVFLDVQKNSTLQFNFVGPFSLYLKSNPWFLGWGANGLQTFVTLNDPKSHSAVNKKILNMVKRKYYEESPVQLWLQPYTRIRLYSNFANGKEDGGRIDYVRIFGGVAVFILFLACINFMNLATARASHRVKEVCVRKVVGARRYSLIFQFLGESVLLSMVSLLIAILIVQLFLPFFNELTSKEITIAYGNSTILSGLVSISLITGLMAGSYPAFFLSSFNPLLVLKGNLSPAVSGASLRKVLVVFQFALSVVLIISAMTVSRQIEYIQHKNLGVQKENIIYFDASKEIRQNFEVFKNTVLSFSGIQNVTLSSENPLAVGHGSGDLGWEGKSKDEMIGVGIIECDQDYIPTTGIHMAEGRNYSEQIAADTSNFIVNEEAVKRMGLMKPVIGQLLNWGGEKKGHIVGIVKDFHINTLRTGMEPVVLLLRPGEGKKGNWYQTLVLVKMEGSRVKEAIHHVETVYKQIEGQFPLDYKFLDESFARQYSDEMTIGKVADLFTALAVFISCLGLFGLASFTAEKRRKEIGIRKILGASVYRLVFLLCSSFAKLVLIALIVGIPTSYYLMQRFLQRYAFHTDVTAQVFVVAAVGLLLLTIVTVVYQSARTAIANPVESLRTE